MYLPLEWYRYFFAYYEVAEAVTVTVHEQTEQIKRIRRFVTIKISGKSADVWRIRWSVLIKLAAIQPNIVSFAEFHVLEMLSNSTFCLWELFPDLVKLLARIL